MNSQIDLPKFVQELLSASFQGPELLTQKLSLLIQYPVIMTDSLFQVRSSSIEMENIIVDENFIINSDQNNEESLLFRCQFFLDNEKKYGIASKIKSRNKTFGYLIMICDRNDLKIENYQAIITYSSSLCALCFERKIELRNERLKLKEVFLFDLLYGNMKQIRDIVDYGKLWGWDFAIPHAVVVFFIKDFDFFTGDQQLIHTLLAVIEKTLLHRNIRPIILEKQQEVIMILPENSQSFSTLNQYLKDIASLIFNQLEGTHLENRIACGIGKAYESPTDIFRSYQEAKVAYDIGLLLEIDIPFFTELGLERILFKHDLQDLKEFYEHTLGDLQRYDIENGTNLMEILETFTIHQFDITRTSQELFLHRNTLRYKLKKMEEILGQKLDDWNTRLNILAAIKMRRLRKI